MKPEQNQTTTARLPRSTHRKAAQARLRFGYSSFEDAVNDFILRGVKSKREEVNSKKQVHSK